jgi:hypothetical protein
MTEKIGYKLNPKKLQKAPQYITPYLFLGAFYYTEDYEYFDVIKPYLDFPEESKTLEEISQELEEKIDKRIKRVKEQFNKLGYTQEYQYQVKFNRIFENFEYAQKSGSFPLKLSTSGSYLISGSGGAEWSSAIINNNFIIKQGNNHEGYYTFGNCRSFKYYMNKKPNFVVRFCMDKLLEFKWVDEK